MTAEEVRSVIFQNATLGGYKKSDVDLFLEEVAVCIESMTAKIRALEKEKFNASKGQPIQETPVVEPKAVEIPIEKPEIPEISPKNSDGISDYGIQSLLLRAQKLAEQIEDEARQSSRELLDKAADDAREIIARADRESEDIIEKANAILADAERKEESLNAAARAEAENIINEAVARSGQMLTSTREKLKTEHELCEKLRVDFTEVKNAITGFYEEQLRQLSAISIDSKVEDIPEEISSVSESVAEPEIEPTIELETEEEVAEVEDISSFSAEETESEPAEINFDISNDIEE